MSSSSNPSGASPSMLVPLALVVSAAMRNGNSSSQQRSLNSILYMIMIFQQIQRMGLFDTQRQHGRNAPRIPYVTLTLALICSLLYFFPRELQRFLPFRIDTESAAIQPDEIIKHPRSEWSRLFLGVLLHGSDQHLYYNIVSLLYKGSLLEQSYGSVTFASMCGILTALSGISMVSFSWLLEHSKLRNFSDYHTSTVGISGLLFAFKVLLNHDPNFSGGTTNIGGFEIANQYAPWAELLFIQLLVPNVSFIGHLSGILAGVSYTAATSPNAPWPLRIAPFLLLVAPLRALYRKLTGHRGGSGSGNRLGRPDTAAATSSASTFSRFIGSPQRFPSPSAPASEEDHRPSAPPAESSSTSSSPVVATYTEQMQQLWSMGYHNRKENYAALKAAMGNVTHAVERLINRK